MNGPPVCVTIELNQRPNNSLSPNATGAATWAPFASNSSATASLSPSAHTAGAYAATSGGFTGDGGAGGGWCTGSRRLHSYASAPDSPKVHARRLVRRVVSLDSHGGVGDGGAGDSGDDPEEPWEGQGLRLARPGVGASGRSPSHRGALGSLLPLLTPGGRHLPPRAASSGHGAAAVSTAASSLSEAGAVAGTDAGGFGQGEWRRPMVGN